MKTLTKIAGLAIAVLVVGSASAVDLTPVPEAPGTLFLPGQPMPAIPMNGQPMPGEMVYVDSPGEPLFQAVKYVDKHEMHPCAVTKIVRVNNPCLGKHSCNTCCEPECVYIQICIPPCGCETVRCRKHGDRVRYDYGKYAVDVRVKKGFIVVDYQK